MRIVARCMTLLLLVTVAAAFLEPARAQVTCPGEAPETTDLKGLVGTAQPVVLVHGWTGGPMQATRAKLEAKPSHSKRQYLLFDYEDYNTCWASNTSIATCLATYVDEISRKHRELGGDGLVYLVAHSMGGLAIRFALDPEYGGVLGLADRVGGVITLDTPHTGTGWGDTFLAAAKSFFTPSGRWSVKIGPTTTAWLPKPGADAWRCLKGGPGTDWNGCAAPPLMPGDVPLMQVVGDVRVRRTLFGVEAYTMFFAGDAIVPSTSQWGGGPDSRTVTCTRDAGDLMLGGPMAPLLLAADNATLNLFDTSNSPSSAEAVIALEPVLTGLVGTGCSHINMPTYDDALLLVDHFLAKQLRENATPALTADQILNSWVPAGSCGDDEVGWDQPVPIRLRDGEGVARFADGSFAGSSIGSAEVLGFADFDGDGIKDVALKFTCFGSLPEHCCAGQSSMLTFVDVLSVKNGRRLRLIAPPIRPGDSFPGNEYGPAPRAIQSASLSGSTITTFEYVLYAHMYTSDELGGGDPNLPVEVEHRLHDGRWESN